MNHETNKPNQAKQNLIDNAEEGCSIGEVKYGSKKKAASIYQCFVSISYVSHEEREEWYLYL